MLALEVRNLSKSFGTLKAVDDISFSIKEGSIFGLIGRNGAGKTTTIRMLMNIYLPDAGSVLLRGKPVDNNFKNIVGYLPEERGLYKKMKVLETIMQFAELKGKKGRDVERKALEYLERFDLADRKMSKIEDLSKGNQQKVQFIITMVHNPEFIILDEPFSGLDPINTNLLKDIILEKKREGKVIIFSTHLMEFAEKMCDEIAMINKGKLILEGSLRDIKNRFAQKNVSMSYDGDISFLQNHPIVEKIENFGNTVGIRVHQSEQIQELLRVLVDHQVIIHKFIANEISLHEIFLELAGKDPLEVSHV